MRGGLKYQLRWRKESAPGAGNGIHCDTGYGCYIALH